MKTFNNVKSITFKAYFHGKGCVNFDSADQRYTLAKFKLVPQTENSTLREINSNVQLAKKTFSCNKDGRYGFKHKVSSDCIRHEMFKEEMGYSNQQISYLPHVFYNAIASPVMIERGYLFADSNTKIPTLRKKSVIGITDAVAEEDWQTAVDLDVHSKSGERSDTSLFYTENVGEKMYSAEGFIDLTELQFISADIIYDRGAVTMDDGSAEAKIYLQALKNNFHEDYTFKSYYMENSLAKDEWAERGILLSEQAVNGMVKDIIRRISNVNIWRKGAFLKFDKMELTVNYEGNRTETIILTENASDVEDELEAAILPSVNDLEDFTFNYYRKYIEADDEKIKGNKAEMEKTKAEAKASKKAKK